MKRHRFKVIEYASHYAVLDSKTGEERAMSDGVDVLFTPTGCSMRPGSEYFRRTWEASLNHNPDETFEAYFDIAGGPAYDGHEVCSHCGKSYDDITERHVFGCPNLSAEGA